MSATEWIISIGGAFIATILAIATFFIQKWIQTVDESIKEHSKDLKDNTVKIVSLEQSQGTQTKNISSAIQAELATFKFPHGKIDKIERQVEELKEVTQKKVLPTIDNQSQQLGKITVIETTLYEHNEKMVKLFEVVKKIVDQRRPGQK